jgi:hypothetical protein
MPKMMRTKRPSDYLANECPFVSFGSVFVQLFALERKRCYNKK